MSNHQAIITTKQINNKMIEAVKYNNINTKNLTAIIMGRIRCLETAISNYNKTYKVL